MPRRKKAIAIDLADLTTALDDHSGLPWYLDTSTGDVLPVPDDADDDLLLVPREALEASDRFVLIEPIESRRGWEEMRDFAARTGDRRLRELLGVALAGKGAFKRFRALLADHPEERARWLAEHDQHTAEQMRAWLERLGIAWTARGAAAPAEGRAATAGDGAATAGDRAATPRSEPHGAASRAPRPKCHLCSGKASGSVPWVDVHPEAEGLSFVQVDATLRLCPEHRSRLLRALDLADSDRIEPPGHVRSP